MRRAIALLALLALAAAPTPTPSVRAQSRESNITADLERAVEAGLAWLVRTQKPDGSWSGRYGTEEGVVGLAVLACLARGEMPGDGPRDAVIRRGIDYILSRQKPNGFLSSGGTMYSHGFATLALAEAYGVVDDERLGPALRKAVGLIVSAQNAAGGWRYSPAPRDADTTVSGAQMMALRAAASAGIEVPAETVERGAKYFKACFCPGGGFGYQGSSGPSDARAGIGMLSLALSGHFRDPEVKATADWIRNRMTQLPAAGSYRYYATYYCSQAMYQAGGRYWREWNASVTPRILAAQLPDGSWQADLGPICDTAFALLSIEINYQLLPIYQR